MRTLLVCSLLVIGGACHAAAWLYDLGTEKSALMSGFSLLTEKMVFAPEKGFGWDAAEGMKPYVQVYDAPIENKSRGAKEPPPIFTNALTEDCLVGDKPRVLKVQVPAGDYTVYLLCGTSASLPYQYFDFQVKAGQATAHVQFEGRFQFRNRRLQVTTAGEPLEITFEPRSKWVCNTIMIWDQADAARMERLIADIEDRTYNLPPEEMTNWKFEPLPAATPLPEVSAADRARGFLLYSKPYVECIYPNTNPAPHELNPTLRIFATPGEYEPLTFAVRTLRPLKDVRVEPGDIGPIAAKTVDVRHVRYMKVRPNYSMQHIYRIVPDILEHFASLDLPAQQSDRFWLTVRVPENAKPGIYSGTIGLLVEGKRTEIPVRLRVLDIKLREDPGKIYGIYYYDPMDRVARATDDISKEYFRHKSELEHADMLAHGTRNVTMSVSCSPADAQGNFKADWEPLAAKIEMGRKFNFTGPIVMGMSTGSVFTKWTKESFGNHLRGLKLPPQGFFDEMRNMAAFIEAERVKRGWPEFLYYPIDEPGSSPEEVQFMAELLKSIQSAGVRTYVTADPTHDAFAPLMPFVSVWCTQPFAPDRETILKDTAARKVEYWCYPNHVSGENDHTTVKGGRMTYGFGFWRSGFRTLIPWIYQSSSGDPFNCLDGSTSDFMNRSEDDGTPMPVTIWEGFREGYDDYRYVYTLESMIKEARAAGKAAAADEAEQQLQYVWNAIKVQTKYKYDGLWPGEEYDVYRWIVAQAILKLQGA